MGNSQNLFPLEAAEKDVVSSSDTTLLSTVGSTNTAELIDYGQNESWQNNGASNAMEHNRSSNHRNDSTYSQRNDSNYAREIKRGRTKYMDYRGADRNVSSSRDMDQHYRLDYQGSPIPFSDHSTDGESGISDTYKHLIKRDYLSTKNGFNNSSNNSTPSRVINSVSSGNSEVPYTCAIDLNLDYTIHVGKLAIYLKQIRFNINRIDEFVIDGGRIRGKIKSALLNPTKGQKSTSNIFEAVRRDRKVVYVDMDECFVVYLFPKHDIPLMSLSFKVYICKKLFREFNIGERLIKLRDLDLNAEMLPMTVTFGETLISEKRPRSLQPVVLPKSEKLEILLSLEYNADTARLIVNVDQTTKLDELRYESKREIIVQAELVSPSCECVQRKTTFLKISEDNPGSNKAFEFDLPQEDLLLNTLMLSVSYSTTRWLQQEKIGWIAFGRNCSGQVEAEHWDLMISQSLLHEAAIQWHCLCESPDVNKSHTLLTRVFK